MITDEDIINALRCHTRDFCCETCIFYHIRGNCSCSQNLTKYARRLIKRLQKRIKELEDEVNK